MNNKLVLLVMPLSCLVALALLDTSSYTPAFSRSAQLETAATARGKSPELTDRGRPTDTRIGAGTR